MFDVVTKYMDGICGGCGNHCVLRQFPVIKNFGGLRSHPNRATLTRRSAQRLVLYAKDRGCTAPGCDVPGYFTEVHHVRKWAERRENITAPSTCAQTAFS